MSAPTPSYSFALPTASACAVVFVRTHADEAPHKVWLRCHARRAHDTTLTLFHEVETITQRFGAQTAFATWTSGIAGSSMNPRSPINFVGYVLEHDEWEALTDFAPSTLPAEASLGIRALMALSPNFNAALFQPIAALKSRWHWREGVRHCARCGAHLQPHAEENAGHCQACSRLHYPSMHPAVLCVVKREDRLLLVQSHKMPSDYFTAIAGFVEVGETLEECVAREVFEEANLHIKSAHYFGSQTWCFPHDAPAQLMVAFVAEYASGEFQGANQEINDARWIKPGDPLPLLPPPATLSRRLINHVLLLCRQD